MDVLSDGLEKTYENLLLKVEGAEAAEPNSDLFEKSYDRQNNTK